jgi:hypothetical protein
MDADIHTGDTVISTRYYDAGVFVCDPIYKKRERQETTRDEQGNKHTRFWEEDGEEIPQPYTETVRDNDDDSRCASLSVKCARGTAGSREEKRIKVKKLNLMGWDEERNSYPRMSGNIIFRQRTLSFADTYRHSLDYFKGIAENRPAWMSDDQHENAVRYSRILSRLAEIPPFICFYDEKYGFLVKRAIQMTRIVYAPVVAPSISSAVVVAQAQVEDKVKAFAEHIDRREATEVSFKEAVVMEAMKPDRVGVIVEKHGIDGVEQTFDPKAEGVGLPEGHKARRKVIKVKVAPE